MKNDQIQNKLFIELHVPDFKKIKKFYSQLGFNIILEEPIKKRLGYLVMQRQGTKINFYGGDRRVYKQSFFKHFPKETKRGYEVEITIPINNIEKYYRKVLPSIKKSLTQKLELKRWGKKDFRLVDPFGFYLRFTEPMDWSLCFCRSGKVFKKCHGK